MPRIKAILSDADGTLVNTVYLIRHGQYEAATSYLVKQGMPRHHIPTYEAYERALNQVVGGNTRETFERTLQLLFEKTPAAYLPHIDFEELDATLGPVQDRIAPLYVEPFVGLDKLLLWLGQEHLSLGIFTSGTPRHIVRNFGISLPTLGFTELFLADDIAISERLKIFITRIKAVYGIDALSVITCEDVTKTKPDPEGILKLLDALEVKPEEAIALGDHAVDIQAAKSAGVGAIGITHGFGTSTELEEAGALSIVKDLQSVATLITKHNTGTSLLF